MGVNEQSVFVPSLILGGAGVPGLTFTGRAINCQPWRDGQSILVSLPQRATAARTCTATWQSSPMPQNNEGTYGFDGVNDGNLAMNTAANTKLSVSTAWTTTVARQIHKVSFWLSRTGVPTLASGAVPSMRVRIYTDAAGDPNAQVGIWEAHVACAAIPLFPAMTKCTFTFDCPIDIAAATPYHVVLFADYTASAVNYIRVHFNTVGVGAQRCRELDVGWAAAALRNFWCEIIELNFAAEVAGILLPTAHTVITANSANQANIFIERINFNVNALVNGPYIRPVLAFGAGALAWADVMIGATFFDPLVIPTDIAMQA